VLVRARDIPSPQLHNGSHLKKIDANVWYCKKCVALVMARKGTNEPVGRLANARLRSYRCRLHLRLDKLWKFHNMSRTRIYHILASKMNIPFSKCHIGNFNMKECRKADKAITWIENYVGKYC
jgi:hypothetical protein